MRRRALPSRRRPQLGRGYVRGRAGRSLVVADDDLRALLNRLPAMVGYWDSALRNRMANDAYREYFGLTPQQMRGIHIKEVLGPELFAKNQPYMLRALAGEAQLFDVTIVDTAKRTRHAQASYIPDIVDGKPRGFFVLLTDITSRRENEQALEAAEARFRTLFEFAPIGTYLADDQGRILDVNPAGAELLGGERDALVGSSVSHITHPDDRETSRVQLARLVKGEIDAYRMDKRYLHADGHTIWAQLDVIALRDGSNGGPVVLAQIQDISGRHHYEAQLRDLADRDPLSGLLNRRGILTLVERQAAEAALHGSAGALLLLDLDGFKQVNDTLGHQAGDKLIVTLAERLDQSVRSTDVVGRLGGDEFAIVLTKGDAAGARRVGDALVDVVRGVARDVDVCVSASVGVAIFDADRSGDDVIAAADASMYAAKAAGGDRVTVETRP